MNSYFQTTPVVKNLIIANVIAFMATMLIPNLGIREYGMLYWFEFPEFHTYQFITYMFLHANFTHLLFNMFALWMFGRVLEYEIGQKRFLIYYMICGIGAALIQMLTIWVSIGLAETTYYIAPLLGASGATMGLLLAYGVMHPNAVIMLLIPPIPIKAKWFVVIYGVISLFMGWRGGDNIAHFAHVGGMLWGFLLLHYWKRKGIIRF